MFHFSAKIFVCFTQLAALPPPTMDLLEQPQIWGEHNVPPISYACFICAILMKLSEIKYFDK